MIEVLDPDSSVAGAVKTYVRTCTTITFSLSMAVLTRAWSLAEETGERWEL